MLADLYTRGHRERDRRTSGVNCVIKDSRTAGGAHTEHRDQQTDKPSGPPETQTSEKTQRSKGPGTTNTRGDKPQPQEESQANGGTNADL